MRVMKRRIYSEMIEWKSKWANRYALMIEGARRTGKSYIMDTGLLISHAFSENRAALTDIVKAILFTKSKISSAHNVYPIEVKSNKEYSTTSLDRFRTKFKHYVATPIVLHPKDLATKNGIRYLPLYMAPLVTGGME